MKHSVIFSALLSLCILASGCASTASDGEVAEIDPAKVDSSAPVDSAIFVMGRQTAAAMLDNCSTIGEVERELLDIKARIHLIGTRVGKTAAEDFTKGFTSYIKANNDSLAVILFE